MRSSPPFNAKPYVEYSLQAGPAVEVQTLLPVENKLLPVENTPHISSTRGPLASPNTHNQPPSVQAANTLPVTTLHGASSTNITHSSQSGTFMDMDPVAFPFLPEWVNIAQDFSAIHPTSSTSHSPSNPTYDVHHSFFGHNQFPPPLCPSDAPQPQQNYLMRTLDSSRALESLLHPVGGVRISGMAPTFPGGSGSVESRRMAQQGRTNISYPAGVGPSAQEIVLERPTDETSGRARDVDPSQIPHAAPSRVSTAHLGQFSLFR